MKVTVYTVTTATYEAGDNNLHLEERMVGTEQEATEKFNELCDAMHDDVFGMYDNPEDAENAITEMRDDRDYVISREEGTEFEYQGKVQIRWNYIEVPEPKPALRDCYLLYETDAWNSEDSKVLLGVFQGDEELLNAVRTLARKELEKDINHFNQFDEDALDDMTDEERKQAIDDCIEMVIDEFTDNNLQTQAYDTNYYATTAMINELDEDGIR